MNDYTQALFSLYLLFAILGLILGGLFTRIIFRQSVDRQAPLRGPSVCPNCGKRIRFTDQIPLFGYLRLSGRCRRCHQKISPLYPMIEILYAVLMCFSLWYFDFSPHGLIAALVSMILFALAMIDQRVYRLPNGLIFSLIFLAVLDCLFYREVTLASRCLALSIGAVMYLIRILSGGGIGLGDIKLVFAGGMLLGFEQTIVACIIAVLAGGLEAIMYHIKKENYMPFGPALCFGLFVSLFFSDQIIQWYLALIAYGM